MPLPCDPRLRAVLLAAPALTALAVAACSEPTAPGVRMEARAEGRLKVVGDIAWHTLEVTALPTLQDCASGDPVRGPVNVHGGGALYEDFRFEVVISGRIDAAGPVRTCFEIEVKPKDTAQGPRVRVGPVELLPEPGGPPLEVTLEYDGSTLRVHP